MLLLVHVALVIVGLAGAAPATSSDPIAYPPQGPIEGFVRNISGKPSTAFLGIPYAAPPVGELRFERPRPHPVWDTPFQAKEYGDGCLQPIEGFGVESFTPANPEYFERYVRNQSYSENCLNLNIFYPGDFNEREDNEKKAVMVWIHGGGYFLGSAFLTNDGELLSQETDIIVVTIHYRLGSFGFLVFDDTRYPGNDGLWDQRQALIWIRENIGAFGGDPDKVTVFGESAGAQSVLSHIISPASAGLINSAIGQSAVVARLSPAPQELLKESTNELIRRFDCERETFEERVACMKLQPAADIMNETRGMLPEGYALTSCADGQFVPYDFLDRLESGNVNRMKTMWLTTKFEAGLFMLGIFEDPLNEGLTEEQSLSIAEAVSFQYENQEAARDELVAFYFPGDWDDKFANLNRTTQILTDAFFLAPTGFILESLSKNNMDTYELYFLPRPSFMAEFNFTNGAFHGDEIYFAFGDYVFTNGTEEEKILSKSIMHMFGTFAKTGTPTYLTVDNEKVAAPLYDVENRSYLGLDINMSRDYEGTNLLIENKRLFNIILPSFGGKTFHDPSQLFKLIK